jgi:ankyrin repeat protein
MELLLAADEHAHDELLQQLIRRDDAINSACELEHAADRANAMKRTLEAALLSNPIDCNVIGANGSSPLVMVCTQGRVREARLLVQNGADVNMETLEFDDAAGGGISFALVEQLRNTTDGKQSKLRGWARTAYTVDEGKKLRTPLLAAAGAGHAELVRVLLELGADVNQGKSDDGATAIYISAQDGYVDVATVLFEYGASPPHPLRTPPHTPSRIPHARIPHARMPALSHVRELRTTAHLMLAALSSSSSSSSFSSPLGPATDRSSPRPLLPRPSPPPYGPATDRG